MTDLARLAPLLPHLDRLIEAADARAKSRTLAPLERQARRALRRHWNDQSRLLIDQLDRLSWRFTEAVRLTEAGPIPDAELDRIWLAVTAATAAATAATFDRLAPRALLRGHRATTVDVGLSIDFDLAHPRAVGYLEQFGAARVTAIDATTRGRLQTLLVTSGDQGWSYGRASREIRRQFAGFSDGSPLGHIRDRGELVAVTEMADAYGFGAELAREQLAAEGVAVEMAWDSTGDERECPECDANAAVGWVASTETFPSGHTHEPAHPGCRCATTTRVAAGSRVGAADQA